MKKFFVFLLVLVAIGWVLFTSKGKDKDKDLLMESILPEGALAYANFSDIQTQIEDFKKTDLYQNVKKIDIRKPLTMSGAPQEIVDEVMLEVNTFRGNIAKYMLGSYFGQEIGIGIYSPDIPRMVEMAAAAQLAESDVDAFLLVREGLSGVFVVSQMSYQATITSLFKGVVQDYLQEEDIEIQDREYKKHPYSMIVVEGHETLSYTKLGECLVMGFGDRAVRDCIDVSLGEKKSLEQDSRFVTAKKTFLEDAQGFGYVHYPNVLELYRQCVQEIVGMDEGAEDTQALLDELEKGLEPMEGFGTQGWSYVNAMPLARVNMNISYDPKRLMPYDKVMYQTPPSTNKTLAFAPHETLYYFWLNYLHPEAFLDYIKAEMALEQEALGRTPDEALAALDVALGMSIENDIVPSLGHEFGGYFGDVDMMGMFPIPELLMFVSLADKDKAGNLIEELLLRGKIEMREAEYQGIAIKHYPIPMIGALNPAYCVFNDYLLVSTHPKLLKASIDGYNGTKPSLITSAGFKEVDYGLSDENNYVAFAKTDAIFQKLQDLLQWGLQMILIQEQAQQSREQLEYFANDVIIPILEGLGQQSSSGTRTVFDKKSKEVNIDTFIFMKEGQYSVSSK